MGKKKHSFNCKNAKVLKTEDHLKKSNTRDDWDTKKIKNSKLKNQNQKTVKFITTLQIEKYAYDLKLSLKEGNA